MEPTGAAPGSGWSGSSLADVVRACIAGGFGRLVRYGSILRQQPDGPDPEAVHQARVATRRLRSDLRTFAPVLDETRVAELRAELGWLAAVLGAARDADVLRAAFEASGLPPSAEAGRQELLRALAAEQQAARAQVASALDSPRYRELYGQLSVAATAPPYSFAEDSAPVFGPGSPAVEALPVLVRAPWSRLRRLVRAVPREPDDAELHRIRIRAKQLRYAAEAAVPVVGEPARATVEAAKALQELLGRHHDAVAAERWLTDAVAAERWLTDAAPARSGLAGFAAGWMAAEQRGRQAELRNEWRSAWHALAAKSHRAWLTP